MPRRRVFHWDDIFPIVDAPSARLMKIKATCLMHAGVITALQKSEIERRADLLIVRVEKRDRPRRTHSAGRKRAA